MSGLRRIRWGWVVGAAFLSEALVLGVFFLILLAATFAGVPEITKPMSPLDNVDARVSSFVAVFLFSVWVGRRVESERALHGALIGVVAALLFTIVWIATTRSWPQPTAYVVAHALKGSVGSAAARSRSSERGACLRLSRARRLTKLRSSRSRGHPFAFTIR